MPTEADIAPAYLLWVELATRITTQRLHRRSGDEETAAGSVRSLFPTVRGLIEKHPSAAEFRKLGTKLLNETLRPYTSRWHGWMTSSEDRVDERGNPISLFRDERVRRKFRGELEELRQKLIDVRIELAEMAGVDDQPQEEREEQAHLGERQRAGIGPQVDVAVPPADKPDGRISSWGPINDLEKLEILRRRAILGRLEPGDTESPPTVYNATGLALSGGGIRSASFCLGIVQVLAERKLLSKFDYLSTVSGGGYLGAFLSCALGTTDSPTTPVAKPCAANTPSEQETAAPTPASAPPQWTRRDVDERIEDVFFRSKEVESGLIRHLRNNSKYLLNGGAKTRLEIAGILLSGITYNFLMVLPLALAMVLLIYGLAGWRFWGGAMAADSAQVAASLNLSGVLLAVVATIFGIAWLILPGIQLVTHGAAPRSRGAIFRRRWEWLTIYLGVAVAICLSLYALPTLFHGFESARQWIHHSGWDWLRRIPDWFIAGGAGAGTTLLGLVTLWVRPRWPWLQGLLVKLFILSGPLWFAFIGLLVGNRLGLAREGGGVLDPFWVLGTTVLLGLWGAFLVNINTLAPHRFYRAKLCECYLVRRSHPDKTESEKCLQAKAGERVQGRTESLLQVRLCRLNQFPAAPYHLINTTLNLPGSSNKELRGRNGDFFLVSRHFCGAPTVGYLPTTDVEAADPHFDLGTAMAVSGAAASTNMGWKSMPHFRFLMTLFNIRLGYWIRRPGEPAWPRWREGVGPWYLYREMAASISETCRYINLSDGGHIENLAVYELLRRRCKFIVCVDGGQEAGMECEDLIRLQRYAEIDLGIRMHYDIGDLRVQPNRLSRAYGVLVKINYDPNLGRKSQELGWMLYLKLAVTGTEPPYVTDYRRQNDDFPHQTTGDQFFDEAQFEAYRMLGECAAESFLSRDLIDKEEPESMEAWFQALANGLLPDNDPAFSFTPSSTPKDPAQTPST